MLVAELLEQEGISQNELSRRLDGLEGTSRAAIQRMAKAGEEVPQAWLDELYGRPPDQPAGEQQEPVESSSARDSDRPPRRPASGRVQRVDSLNYRQLQDYIAGGYKLAGQTIRASDPVLASIVDGHADRAGAAWAAWIESEPKVAAMLQRLMIGTPMGEVIGVHISIAFAYVLARGAQRQIAADYAAQQQQQAEAAAAGQHDGAAAPPVA